jgi:hypothetical protein
MATSKAAQQISGRGFNFRGGSDASGGNVGADVRHPPESGYVAVVVLLILLFCLLLPLMALLYFDTLTIQKKAERTEAKIEKMLKELEKKDKQ